MHWLRSVVTLLPLSMTIAFRHTSGYTRAHRRGVRFTHNVVEDHSINFNLGTERVLYADNDIVVVDKPANTQSVSGFLYPDNLAARVSSSFGLPRHDVTVVHRLDYATSGVIVFARNEWALKRMHAQFRCDDVIEKTYCAIVEGIPAVDCGEIDAPLGKNPLRGTPYIGIDYSGAGKPSRTLWTRLESRDGLSLLLLRPLTGRFVHHFVFNCFQYFNINDLIQNSSITSTHVIHWTYHFGRCVVWKQNRTMQESAPTAFARAQVDLLTSPHQREDNNHISIPFFS